MKEYKKVVVILILVFSLPISISMCEIMGGHFESLPSISVKGMSSGERYVPLQVVCKESNIPLILSPNLFIGPIIMTVSLRNELWLAWFLLWIQSGELTQTWYSTKL